MLTRLIYKHAAAARACAALVLACCAFTSLPAAPVNAASRAGAQPPREQRVAKPKRASLEYRLSWGLSSIKADRAYTRGFNGSGMIVAMIDAGMTRDAMGLFAHVSPASIDLIDRRTAHVDASHARQTAAMLAAPLDGEGTLGVAYGASLLSIRIDADGSCAQECFARSADLARGIDYALANGAKIIAVPMVGPRRLKGVEPALERAAAAGALIVAAAGNDGADEASWPARYAADPRFRDAILVVGASTIAGQAATWTNRAGTAADRYLMAPGEKLLVDCDSRTCHLVSGTSFAVPYVAGALSLLMDAQETLSAQDAGKILLASASDRGLDGPDPVTGRGLLDVRRALRSVDQRT